ncbi:MAG: hypothetical protein LWX56_07970 [Ignavibacteria bacterium]|nr:hypothetical protein [Ignavibacteria bacterium]
MEFSKILASYHSHPDGVKKTNNGRCFFSQPPSERDIAIAGTPKNNFPLNNYFLSDKIYSYNGKSVLATLPKNVFFGLGKAR